MSDAKVGKAHRFRILRSEIRHRGPALVDLLEVATVRIVLDISTLGELVGRVIGDFCDYKGVEFAPEDDAVAAQATLAALEFMFDRAEFARASLADIDGLPDLINFEPADGFPGSFTE